jgi:hypothetical protein
MEENEKKRLELDTGKQSGRLESSLSVEAAQIAGVRKMDQLKVASAAAREYARSIAGENKVKFIHAFQIALDLAVSALRAGPAEADVFSKVMRRGISLMPEHFYSDRTLVENMVSLINSDIYVYGGEPAPEFQDCVATGPSSSGGWCCSGTLIALNAVLTAGHCIGQCSNWVYVGEMVDQPDGKPYKVADCVLHPHFSGELFLNDLGILFLEDNVAGGTPRPRAGKDMIDAAKYITIAGYGSTEKGGVGGEGQRLKAPMIIQSTSCSVSDQNQFFCHEGLEIVAAEKDKDSCPGDSGGPAYIQAEDGLWYLAGVTSRHVKNELQCGDGSIYVRVDKYEEWISGELKKRPPKS